MAVYLVTYTNSAEEEGGHNVTQSHTQGDCLWEQSEPPGAVGGKLCSIKSVVPTDSCGRMGLTCLNSFIG